MTSPSISHPASSPLQRAQVDVGEIWNPSAEYPSASVSIAISGSLPVTELFRPFFSLDRVGEDTANPVMDALTRASSRESCRPRSSVSVGRSDGLLSGTGAWESSDSVKIGRAACREQVG